MGTLRFYQLAQLHQNQKITNTMIPKGVAGRKINTKKGSGTLKVDMVLEAQGS